MSVFLSIWNHPVAIAAALVLIVLTAPLTVEIALLTAASLLPGARRRARRSRAVRLAVVIPAHNEELLIARAVRSVQAAAGADAVIVVADNCTDRTEAVAAAAGARVLVRTDAVQRGKGFALRFAFDTLTAEGFDSALVIDADSVISANLITQSRFLLEQGEDVVQCRYEVANQDDSPRTRLMQLAFLAFNVLRPLGRSRLGLSAGIYGNGFAVNARAMELFEASSIVEDLEFHLSLLRNGMKVAFAEEAVVWGDMPTGGAASETQRSRWEGGRLRMAVLHAGGLMKDIAKGRVALIEPLLDLVGLPLAFHVAAVVILMLVPAKIAFLWGAVSLAVVLLYALRAASVGDFEKNLRTMALAPGYVIWKLAMARSILRGAHAKADWVRTQRTMNG
jgi:cellulose synthase/poly-beta-1,6-N-acetylglucosamine synthase-like glycosyltransferase